MTGVESARWRLLMKGGSKRNSDGTDVAGWCSPLSHLRTNFSFLRTCHLHAILDFLLVSLCTMFFAKLDTLGTNALTSVPLWPPMVLSLAPNSWFRVAVPCPVSLNACVRSALGCSWGPLVPSGAEPDVNSWVECCGFNKCRGDRTGGSSSATNLSSCSRRLFA